MATLAKLFASDVWVVLDSVQFNRRDYQHRMWVSPMAEPARLRLLTLPVHTVAGRGTLIREVEIVDLRQAMTHLQRSTQHLYGRSQYWQDIRSLVGGVRAGNSGPHLYPVAVASTLGLLSAVGWNGRVVYASSLRSTSGDRNRRLVDLCRQVGAQTFLCGTGGISYLDTVLFESARVDVRVIADSARGDERRRSGLDVLARCGPHLLAQWIKRVEGCVRGEDRSAYDSSTRTYFIDWGRLTEPTRLRRPAEGRSGSGAIR
jgi:hypothetical protein